MPRRRRIEKNDSASFSITLPVKPSQTITSARSLNRSRPSTFADEADVFRIFDQLVRLLYPSRFPPSSPMLTANRRIGDVEYVFGV